MLTAERLVKLLREGDQYCPHDLYTDEKGLAYFLNCDQRTVRNRRAQDLPARSGSPTRPIYDIEEIVRWYNAGAASTQIVNKGRKIAEKSGKKRKNAEIGGNH